MLRTATRKTPSMRTSNVAVVVAFISDGKSKVVVRKYHDALLFGCKTAVGVPMAFESVVAISLVNALSKACSRLFFWCRHQIAPCLLRLIKWDINGQSDQTTIRNR